MSTSGDAPNPLRPYYVPPSIGIPPEIHTNASAPRPSSSSIPKNLGSSARDILSDLDYGDYLGDASPSVAAMTKKLMDQAIWKYTSVFLAQPFENAKTILQVQLANGATAAGIAGLGEDMRRHPDRYRDYDFEEYLSEEGSDADEPSYFTSAAPKHGSASRSPERRRRAPDRSHSATPTPSSVSHHKLELRRPDSLTEVIGQLWQKEGAFGVWKGTNVTFVYTVLSKTIESWTRSLLSALFNLPDPGLLAAGATPGAGGLDIIDSPSPLLSIGIAVAAAGVTGILLAPLDLVRTKLILTPIYQQPRAVIPSLRSLPSISCPISLMPVTILHSILPTFITTSAPLFLRSNLRIDPILTPTTYSFATFLSATIELFLKLPLETVLRRGQIQTLQSVQQQRQHAAMHQQYSSFRGGSMSHSLGLEPYRTVVDVGPYKGVFGTMWYIVREEGTQQQLVVGTRGAPATQKSSMGNRKGQGIQGLWRGWRVGMWGLVGIWGAAALGGSAKGGEF